MHIKNSFIFTFISNFKKEEILNLDKKVAIIFRNYKKEYDINEIKKLRRICKTQNRKLYLANNLKLAKNLNLDGAYIPSFNKNLCLQRYNFKKKFQLLGSAHNISEIKIKEKQGVELIFLSPIFKTKNYKRGLNIVKFNILSHLSLKKIIALGGINKKNIKKLKMTNAFGFSGISYFFENL
ncbi:thiamine phosphate synthase [Candidatus Pelagibacter sp.]|nr:thiamine phosphate synthase [Candidatus Pelagibacter sp.]